MKATRQWPSVALGFVLIAAGVFTMGTEIGNVQWIIGLVVVIAGAGLLAWRVASRKRRANTN